ncbi:MAG: hypothetical protein JWM11_4946 [Planctomycetaceae bacterium]|nr:hypothetical protein [Planctomycetaceae bacterium]
MALMVGVEIADGIIAVFATVCRDAYLDETGQIIVIRAHEPSTHTLS